MKEEEKVSMKIEKTEQVDSSKSKHPQKPKSYKTLLPAKPSYPTQLSLIVVYYRPLFPHMVLPVLIQKRIFRLALKYAEKQGNFIMISLSYAESDSEKEINNKKICKIGVLARIVKILENPNSNKEVQVIFEIVGRTQIVSFLRKEPFFLVEVEHLKIPSFRNNDTIRAYCREILNNVRELVRMYPVIKEELNQYLVEDISITDANKLADFTASILTSKKEELQMVLETLNVLERLKKVLLLVKQELDLGKLQAKISKQIEKRISKSQRDFFLNEQLKEIKKELGLTKDDKKQEADKFIERAAHLKFSPEAQKIFDEEIQKIYLLDNHAAEFTVTRNYLDWITTLPWGIFAEEPLNLKKAKKILEIDHYGLEDVKQRILEFIAVTKLAKKDASSVLCFVGPPGVGKTSVGKSIANTLKRPFYRFSVGGMRDEAEIKGHRRTYIGAMPGKFIQTLKQTKVANPVIMLDEIDKMGTSYQGDPASALLEVFDQEQNHSFVDHYLDIPFDLSKVLFIATANQLDSISPVLLDRMEILRLSGYITSEKLHIARRYIIPKQRKRHGLKSTQLNFTDSAITKIIEGYARESGVRHLEKLIQKICRQVAVDVTSSRKKEKSKTTINLQRVEKYLKKPIFLDDAIQNSNNSGIVNGLAWTSMGGDVLSIEAVAMESPKKGLKQTGQLGKVMIESSEIAYSYVIANLKKFKGKEGFFEKHFIHLHVPAGATPKDGPSAGVTMASALISLMLAKPVDKKIGMTGELTLSGSVLAIGGLKEKIIASKRN